MKKLLSVILMLLCNQLVLADTIDMSHIHDIVFFGDSLTDNGNLYQLTKNIPKSPPYYQGRFSNGPTWAEDVGAYFLNQNGIQSSNYAYGGATAILHDKTNDGFNAPVSLDEELIDYFLHTPSPLADRSKTLFSLWIGSNDYLYDRSPDTETLTTNVVDKINATLEKLILVGAQNFLIINVPDLGLSPYAKSLNVTERLHLIAQTNNTKLAMALAKLKLKHPQIKIVYINVFDIVNDLVAHVDQYNDKYSIHLKDITNSCWKGDIKLSAGEIQKSFVNFSTRNSEATTQFILKSPSLAQAFAVGHAYDEGLQPCADPDDYIYWDQVHPTAVVHLLLSQLVEKAITGP